MQIDVNKLQRLEAAAADASLLATAASDRLRDKRRQIAERKAIIGAEWRRTPGCSQFPAMVEDHGWSEARLARAHDLNRFEHGASFLRSIREVEAIQAEVDHLTEDYQRKQERWQKLAAPLPGLQEFAKQYGHKTSRTVGVLRGASE